MMLQFVAPATWALHLLDAAGLAPSTVHAMFGELALTEQKPTFVNAEQVWLAPPSVLHMFRPPWTPPFVTEQKPPWALAAGGIDEHAVLAPASGPARLPVLHCCCWPAPAPMPPYAEQPAGVVPSGGESVVEHSVFAATALQLIVPVLFPAVEQKRGAEFGPAEQ